MDQPGTMRGPPLWCPPQIDVIGGGLWARVITEVLCGMVPPAVEIGIHSAHNHPLLRAWAGRQGLASRVRISAGGADFANARSKALIIVNAARDHAGALEKALPSRSPVLVEKPFTMTAAESRRLITKAEELRTPLAASHVFLFARYLANFTAILADEGPVQHLAFRWTDPQAEVRHGERKTYDPGLPLHVDVLPHISSLIGALLPGLQQRCRRLIVSRGGAELHLDLHVGEVPCAVKLARDAAQRERCIEVTTARKRFTLDFAAEPRVTTNDGRIINADPDWGIKEGPLACMLRAFLTGASSGLWDPRFSVALALQGNELADEATALYRDAFTGWMAGALSQPGADTEASLRYALRELFQAGRHADAAAVETRIDAALRALRGASADNVIDFMAQEG